MPTKFLSCLLMLVVLPATAVFAQTPNAVNTVFTSPDGLFTFQYPASWFVETVNAEMGTDHTSFVVDNLPPGQRLDSADDISIQISYPQLKTAFGATSGGTTPLDILKAGSSQATAQPIVEFTVDGRPAARMTIQMSSMGQDLSYMAIFVDVGNDYLVSINVSSFKGGADTLKKYEPVVEALSKTIRFSPKVVNSGNADLPQVYSGPVGIWQAGTIKFFYPASWVVYTNGIQIIQNTSESVALNAPKTGQVIAMLEGPAETRAGVDPKELGDNCNSRKSVWTARTIVEKMLTFNPAQIQQFKDQGVTISKPVAVTINGKDIVYFYEYQAKLDTLAIFTDLGNSNVPALTAQAQPGEMKQFEKQLLAIAGTFEYTPNPCTNNGASPTP